MNVNIRKSRVELPREETPGCLEDLVSMAQFNALTLEATELLAFAGRRPASHASRPHRRSVSAVLPEPQ